MTRKGKDDKEFPGGRAARRLAEFEAARSAPEERKPPHRAGPGTGEAGGAADEDGEDDEDSSRHA